MSSRERTRPGLGIIEPWLPSPARARLLGRTPPCCAERRRAFHVQTKSNRRGDCVLMFWNSPSQCVVIGHKAATAARECRSSWTKRSGPNSIRRTND